MCLIIEIKKTDISEMSVFNNLEGILPILYIFAGCFFLSFGETFSGIGFRLQTTFNMEIEYLIIFQFAGFTGKQEIILSKDNS